MWYAVMSLHASVNTLFLSPLSSSLHFVEQRDFVLKCLSKTPGVKTAVPQGAFYVLPDVSAHFGKTAPDGTVIGGATDLCRYLLRCVMVYTCVMTTLGL